MIVTDRKKNANDFDAAFMQFVITTKQQGMSKNHNKNKTQRRNTIQARKDLQQALHFGLHFTNINVCV